MSLASAGLLPGGDSGYSYQQPQSYSAPAPVYSAPAPSNDYLPPSPPHNDYLPPSPPHNDYLPPSPPIPSYASGYSAPAPAPQVVQIVQEQVSSLNEQYDQRKFNKIIV